MERAKRAVEKHYAVVGVLEDLNSTLTVLENYIPKFFQGASQVYWSELSFHNIHYQGNVHYVFVFIFNDSWSPAIHLYMIFKTRNIRPTGWYKIDIPELKVPQ